MVDGLSGREEYVGAAHFHLRFHIAAVQPPVFRAVFFHVMLRGKAVVVKKIQHAKTAGGKGRHQGGADAAS